MDAERWSAEEMSGWRAFLEAHARLAPLIEAQLEADGDITHAQYGILLALQAEPQGLPMSRIAETVFSSRSGLTYQVDRLVERGLLTRSVDPDDERRRVVRLTRDGVDVLAAVTPGHLALVRELFVGPVGGRMAVLAAALADARSAAHARSAEA